MRRMVAVLGFLCAGVVVQANESAAQSVNPVLLWNRTLLVIVRTPGAQPATIHPTRSFAIMHAAIYDAVSAIDKGHSSYAIELTGVSRSASQNAAAATAAHEVLVTLYPQFQAMLDADLQQSLASIPEDEHKADGISVGQTVADRLLDLRSQDGSAAPPRPYVFGDKPGDYQSTPPNFPPQPQFTHWAGVRPFALARADQFRPGPPPAVASQQYGRAVNEVQVFGVAGSTAASGDQALTGRFWNGAIQNYWNEIAQTASLAHGLTTAQNARLFAQLNLTFADAVIAFYDAKYTYNLWRPVTAIRNADQTGNSATPREASWLPLGDTPMHPEYPCAHCISSSAVSTVMQAIVGNEVPEITMTSPTAPGVVRKWTRLQDYSDEVSLGRIYAGFHYRFSTEVGKDMGRKIAEQVIATQLRGAEATALPSR